MGWPADDPEGQMRAALFTQALRELGWTVGRNILIEWRWFNGDANRTRRDAAELAELAPDVMVATNGPTLTALLEATRIVPIVFTGVVDPVGSGFVASLSHPGGNATGFANIDFSTSGKWLELLKQIAPGLKRALVLRTASIAGGSQFGALQALAPALGVELQPVDPSRRADIEPTFGAFAREPNGGVIVTASAPANVNRDLIISLVARHRLPAVYSARFWVAAGGLISYGVDAAALYRPAAGYVDRVLKGESPGNLPVQSSTKYETVINLKTAKVLGLTVPPSLLAIADEVIE
jgi:putative ABC transport system substrate-binding protein